MMQRFQSLASSVGFRWSLEGYLKNEKDETRRELPDVPPQTVSGLEPLGDGTQKF